MSATSQNMQKLGDPYKFPNVSHASISDLQ